MIREEILTETALPRLNNNQRIRTKQTEKKEIVSTPDIKMGYGACSVSGCNCQSYMGNSDTCQNCGHNYGLHW